MEKIRRDMGMYNCVVECDVGDRDLDRYVNAVVDERVEKLLADLSRKRPQWVFVTSGYGSAHLDGIHRNFAAFSIEDDEEILGTIETEKDWRTGETVFCLHNKRLNSKRERNGPTKTRKRDKAAKLILANYYLKTIPELTAEARTNTYALIDTLDGNARYAHDRTISGLSAALSRVLVDYPEITEQVRRHLPHTEASKLDALSDVWGCRCATSVFRHERDAKKSVTIRVRGSKYHVIWAGASDAIHSFDQDAVPEPIRQGIGMLKLMNPAELIEDVGVRIDANTFFLINVGETPDGTA
jgi:LmbE family N-acetylglucosaminyl deacetylase